jgi:hypothetical protein
MSPWLESLLDDLADERNWGYQLAGPLAAEPMAIAALALIGHGRTSQAEKAGRRLVDMQGADGGVFATAVKDAPAWTTGWAVLAWSALRRSFGVTSYSANISPALDWILAMHAHTSEKTSDMGHDTRLDGWPWVAGTHSWAEPTAVNVLALKAAGHAKHPRCREAVAMLIDRLLPDGGSNYGNTSVFGQFLRPHVEPTGLSMIAFAGERDASGRIERSLAWLERTLPTTAGGASLSYGILGLAAHHRRPPKADQWLAAAARKTSPSNNKPLRKALLALAAAQNSPFIFTRNHDTT